MIILLIAFYTAIASALHGSDTFTKYAVICGHTLAVAATVDLIGGGNMWVTIAMLLITAGSWELFRTSKQAKPELDALQHPSLFLHKVWKAYLIPCGAAAGLSALIALPAGSVPLLIASAVYLLTIFATCVTLKLVHYKTPTGLWLIARGENGSLNRRVTEIVGGLLPWGCGLALVAEALRGLVH